jgi:hypothetical protein
MSFNRMTEEVQHRFQAEELAVNDSSSWLGSTDKVPEQIDPEIDQDKGKGNK